MLSGTKLVYEDSVTKLVPSPQKVVALLRKAGCINSKAHTTRIPGWHRYTEGYSVVTAPALITVQHYMPHRPDDTSKIVQGMLAKYAEVLAEFNPRVEQNAVIITRQPPGKTLVQVFSKEVSCGQSDTTRTDRP